MLYCFDSGRKEEYWNHSKSIKTPIYRFENCWIYRLKKREKRLFRISRLRYHYFSYIALNIFLFAIIVSFVGKTLNAWGLPGKPQETFYSLPAGSCYQWDAERVYMQQDLVSRRGQHHLHSLLILYSFYWKNYDYRVNKVQLFAPFKLLSFLIRFPLCY